MINIRKPLIIITLISSCFFTPFVTIAGPYEDGQAAYAARNYEKAARILKQGAEQGDAASQNHYGVLYALGHGVPQSKEKAVFWYKIAANQGLAKAQTNLGLAYEFGKGTQQSFTKATHWYLQAAQQGFTPAQTRLGQMYENGKGVEASDFEAEKWYRKAALQDDAKAQFLLGEMYLLRSQNSISEENGKQSFYWIQKAANNTEINAMKRLGFFYQHGTFAEKSEEQAIYWYKKVAKTGDDWAKGQLESMGGCNDTPTDAATPTANKYVHHNQEKPRQSGNATSLG